MTKKELSEKYPQAIKMCGSEHIGYRGQRMKTPKEVAEALIGTFWYYRPCRQVIELCEEVKKRIGRYRTEHTNDGAIVFGTLVRLYGDYGGSPNDGWIDDQDTIKQIIEALNEEIKKCEETIEIYGEDV